MAQTSAGAIAAPSFDLEESSEFVREHRKHLLGAAEMSSQRLPLHQIVIFDISKHGIGARTAAVPPEMNEVVTLMLGGNEGELKGVVCWVEGDRFGIHIDDEIRTDLFELNQRSRDCVPEGDRREVSSIYERDQGSGNSRPLRSC